MQKFTAAVDVYFTDYLIYVKNQILHIMTQQKTFVDRGLNHMAANGPLPHRAAGFVFLPPGGVTCGRVFEFVFLFFFFLKCPQMTREG